MCVCVCVSLSLSLSLSLCVCVCVSLTPQGVWLCVHQCVSHDINFHFNGDTKIPFKNALTRLTQYYVLMA